MSGGTITVGSGVIQLGGTLPISASSTPFRILSTTPGTGSIQFTTEGTITVADGTAIDDLEISAGILGSTLVKNGPGQLRLTGSGNVVTSGNGSVFP
jgi:hypothetical protein